jgi:hypothetical protein
MGLILSVYRNAELTGDYSNNGESARFSKLTVINCEGPFEPTDDAPAVLLESHVRGCLRLRPLSLDVKRVIMFGGNYAATSDSRFSGKCRELLGGNFYGAVAIHDRVE